MFRTEHRPWGWFTTLISNRKFTAKYIVVKPQQSLSLQFHRRRSECWVWVDGVLPRITIGDTTFYMQAGKEYHIPRGTKHRIDNPHQVGTLTILEVAHGRFDEDDIVRLDDKYGRV